MRGSGKPTSAVGGGGCTMLMGQCTMESGWETSEVAEASSDYVRYIISSIDATHHAVHYYFPQLMETAMRVYGAVG